MMHTCNLNVLDLNNSSPSLIARSSSPVGIAFFLYFLLGLGSSLGCVLSPSNPDHSIVLSSSSSSVPSEPLCSCSEAETSSSN